MENLHEKEFPEKKSKIIKKSIVSEMFSPGSQRDGTSQLELIILY